MGRDGRRLHRLHGYSAGRVELGATTARLQIFPRRMLDNHLGRRIDRDQDNSMLDERGAIAHDVPLARRSR